MAGLDAFGTALHRGDGESPEVFTAIASVTNITPPGLERETVEVTAHDSPNGYKEHVGQLKDGGEVEIEINYDPRLHDELVADLDDIEPRNYKVVWPQALGSWAFSAIMTGFEPEAPHDDKLAASVTYKVTGKPVITTAA